MTFKEIGTHLKLRVSEEIVRKALATEGFRCYRARLKPAIRSQTREVRLTWALKHRDWTKDQWNCVFWSDNACVTEEAEANTWVLRRPGEEYTNSCNDLKVKEGLGWMIWARFSGKYGSGPMLLWEERSGSFNAESYSYRIVPKAHEYFEQDPDFIFVLDNTTAHSPKIAS
jgi:hypothetical protein